MHTERVIHAAVRLAAAVVVVAFVAGTIASAFAVTPPHVVIGAQNGSTDACAICHRAHTANTAVPYRMFESTEMTGTSLLIATDPVAGDVSLCFTCHGQGQLGSNKDVQSTFMGSSVHSLAPTSAPYGPSPLYCSTCHDSHGAARIATDTPYPALLRSYEGTRPVYAGEAYCATCHTAASAIQAGERWAGLAVYMDTAHYSGLATPAVGAGIRCSICHDPHGSAVAPLLVAALVPASAPATFAVTADDRTFCVACHGTKSASWEGTAAYATSSHGSSAATVSITATWVPGGSRRVGECQVCHAPMGRNNGSGGAIPKLLEAKGRALCDACHSSTGVAHSTDTSSQIRPLVGALTLAVVSAPDARSAWAGRVALYGRIAPGGGPLAGPREYRVAESTGPSAAGDVDGGSKDELVVASPDSAVLTVLRADPLTGLGSQPTTFAMPGMPVTSRAVAIAVSDVFESSSNNRNEIVVVTSDGELLMYNISISGTVLEIAAGPVPVGVGPWGLAVGGAPGVSDPHVAVTSRDDSLLTFVNAGLYSAVVTSEAVGVAPVAPAIGDVWAGVSGSEIVVGDSGSTTATVRVLDSSGVERAGYLVETGAGKPAASAIGDVLWSVPAAGRAELAVAFVEASGDSSVVVIPQLSSGSGLDTAAAEVAGTGARARTGSLLIGDVDGDSYRELVVGNGGTWARDVTAKAPDTLVFGANPGGTSLAAADAPYIAGGTELAGGVPSLALADFGAVLPSRHPVDEVASSAHISTETASVARHVTCSDCHNTHESTATVAAAPAVSGPMKGAWGVSVAYPGPTFGAAARSTTGYGICFKCHSSYASTLGGRPDLARAFDPANASVHAVEAPSGITIAVSTFVPGWTSSSVLACTDCHGNSDVAQARGPHTSAAAPILIKPLAGTEPWDAKLLCYTCHRVGVYADAAGTDPAAAGSGFYSTGKFLHGLHVARPSSGGHGVSCGACHVSHGSVTKPHLLRPDIGFLSSGVHAGSCTNGCHDPGTTAGQRWWPVAP